MNDLLPAMTAPIGAPRPLVKSIQSLSTCAAYAVAVTPDATHALSNRAPSMWIAMPLVRASALTAPSSSSVQNVPPAKL